MISKKKDVCLSCLYLHHEDLAPLVDENRGHDVGDALLDDRLEVRWRGRLDPLGNRHLILVREGEVAELVHLLVGLALQQKGQVALNDVHLPAAAAALFAAALQTLLDDLAAAAAVVIAAAAAARSSRS